MEAFINLILSLATAWHQSRLILKISLILGFCGLSLIWLGKFSEVQSRRNWARWGDAGLIRIRLVGSAVDMALSSSGRSLSLTWCIGLQCTRMWLAVSTGAGQSGHCGLTPWLGLRQVSREWGSRRRGILSGTGLFWHLVELSARWGFAERLQATTFLIF